MSDKDKIERKFVYPKMANFEASACISCDFMSQDDWHMDTEYYCDMSTHRRIAKVSMNIDDRTVQSPPEWCPLRDGPIKKTVIMEIGDGDER